MLPDLTLDREGTLAFGLYVAGFFDRASEANRDFARLAVALAKFLGNKLCSNFVYKAMERMGGTGYIEDTPLPLFYREAPLNSIWEGSGNAICLDILCTLRREPLAGSVAGLDTVALLARISG